jgi:signal transduction histidine kinase
VSRAAGVRVDGRRTVARWLRGGEGPVSLRRLVIGILAVTGALAVGAIAALAWAYDRQVDVRQRVVLRVDPASIVAAELLSSLVDQETGVRGYVLTADPEFLLPYERGLRTEFAALGRLHELLRVEPALTRRVDGVQAAAGTWRRAAADALISAVRSAGARSVPLELLERSRIQFDAVRDEHRRLVDELAAARAASLREVDARVDDVVALAATLTVLAVAAAVLVWILLRRRVLAPVERLGAAARRVTAGELDHPIADDAVLANAARELVQLGRDLDAMRAQIVTDLASVRLAGARLEEQSLELARSNAELEQFAYVASHDLQEPLRKVASFCRLLEQRYGDQLDDRGRQYVDYAVDGAKRMQQLILGLLELSRVGQEGTRFVAVDCAEVAALAVHDLAETLGQAGAEVVVGELPVVEGDPTLLRAVFQNLVSNAVKFNDSGRPRVTLGAERADGSWRFSCRDNGIGIEPRYAERVFAVFQRLHGRDAYEGTGIGLALCRKIVTYHGGDMWVDRETVDGTVIRWTLPVARRTPSAPTPSRRAEGG